MTAHTTLTVAILDGILNDKMNLDREHKKLIRDFLCPIIDMVEQTKSPEDRMQMAIKLIRLMAVPLGFAMASSLKPEAHRRIALQVTELLYNETFEILDIFKAMEDRKTREAMMNTANMNHTNNTLDEGD